MAKARGTQVFVDTPFLKASQVGENWQVETPHGIFEAEYLVNAAASWAGEVAERAGLEVPVHPVRRIIYATTPTGWDHNFPLTIDLTSGFFLRTEGKRILFGGSNLAELPGRAEGLDWNWFDTIMLPALERFPWLADTELDQKASWWGYYEVTPDHSPILGRMDGVKNWINAAGFSGHGVQQAPMIGKLIAEEITLGKARSINIDTLCINRFSENRLNSEHHIV